MPVSSMGEDREGKGLGGKGLGGEGETLRDQMSSISDWQIGKNSSYSVCE